MKKIFWLSAIILFACNNANPDKALPEKDSLPTTTDSSNALNGKEKPHIYANERFIDVTVEKTAPDNYRVRGSGQIFEANFSWVVEDGHEELKKGFQMTDAGAPAWGKFYFTIAVKKKRNNSTLTLILFEASAKDGSRQHELSIALP